MRHAKTVNVWKCDHCSKEEAWGRTGAAGKRHPLEGAVMHKEEEC